LYVALCGSMARVANVTEIVPESFTWGCLTDFSERVGDYGLCVSLFCESREQTLDAGASPKPNPTAIMSSSNPSRIFAETLLLRRSR
ncbi:MAG: hypothetical protein ACREEE_13320, partial [Dongiaceae bacterium]